MSPPLRILMPETSYFSTLVSDASSISTFLCLCSIILQDEKNEIHQNEETTFEESLGAVVDNI